MDPNILDRKYTNLSLDDHAPPALDIGDAVLKEKAVWLENCLVGKLLSSRMVNREGFRASLRRLCNWDNEIANRDKEIAIESLGRNKFIFYFANVIEKHKVL